MKKQRTPNIELLRIVLMLMIIMHHFVVHGSQLTKLLNNTTTLDISLSRNIMLLFLETFCVIGVNCFIFISGYYGIKIKTKTLISFFTQSIVLSVSLYLFYSLTYYPNNLSFYGLLRSFFPLIIPIWWFFIAYIGIYLLSPIINKGIEMCSRKTLIYICLIFSILLLSSGFRGDNLYTGDGFNVFTLFMVYIIARCCGNLNLEIRRPKSLYVISLVINFFFVFAFYLLNKPQIIWCFFSYGNPFITINAILFFYSFKSMKIRNFNFILQLAPLTFGVYLIHDYNESRLILRDIVIQIYTTTPNNVIFFAILLALCIVVFLSCSINEKVRVLICNPINSKIEHFYNATLSKRVNKINE